MEIEKGKTYRIKSGQYKDSEYRVEGLWHELTGKSWMFSDGNPACLKYALRGVNDDLPNDDNVYYGKIGLFGELIHISEIGEEVVK
jgi:hypothetical protein